MPTATLAQELTVTGSMRVRVEGIDNTARSGVVDSSAMLVRTDIGLEWKRDWLTVGAELEDARANFERTHSGIAATEVNTLEPVQAYLKLGGPSAALTMGRFTLDLSSRRLVSRQNFRNATNAFSGARLDLSPSKDLRATLFWTEPLIREPTDANSIGANDFALDRSTGGLQFFGGWGGYSGFPAGIQSDLYAYRFVEHDTPWLTTRDRRLWTVGARLYRVPRANRIDGEFEGNWQTGFTHLTAAPTDNIDRPVRAFFVRAALGYSFSTNWSPRLGLAVDWASGADGSTTYRRYDTLFGARSFELGPQSLYAVFNRANIRSIVGSAEVHPSPATNLAASVRFIWADNVADYIGNTGRRALAMQTHPFIGKQFEATGRHWLVTERWQVEVGGDILFRSAPLAGEVSGTLHPTLYAFMAQTIYLRAAHR